MSVKLAEFNVEGWRNYIHWFNYCLRTSYIDNDAITMAFDTVSLSSDDTPLKTLERTDDEDVPLKVLEALYVPVKSKILKKKSLEHCDFCEEVFLNKYDALIHNGKHIIIPLIKKQYHQCPLCLFYYTSRYKLKHHTRNKHKNEKADIKQDNTYKTNVKISRDKVDLKEEETKNKEDIKVGTKHKSNDQTVLLEHGKAKYNIYNSDDDDDLPLVNRSKVKHTEIITKCETEGLKQSLLKEVKVVIEKFDVKPEILKVPEKFEPNTKNDERETKHSCEASNNDTVIRNRFIFEDDIDICDDAMMKDLTNDCIVDMNLFDEPWLDEIANGIGDAIPDEEQVICVDEEREDSDEEGVVYTPSTHYDELVKPGVYRCRKCQQMFPTRFNQIQHEMTHMHIRKPRPLLCEYCDRFIANKKCLKDHIFKKHRMHYKPKTFQNCPKCGLKYNNMDKHMQNYHMFLHCHLCNEGFETDIDRLNHIRGHLVKVKCVQCDFVASELEIKEHQKRFHNVSQCVSSAIFNLCELCCMFLKNRQRLHTQYVFGEAVSELGSRLECEHCGNKFFHLTKVRRTVRRVNDRSAEKERDKKKVLTNKERLKNIQQRLKMINKLSRF